MHKNTKTLFIAAILGFSDLIAVRKARALKTIKVARAARSDRSSTDSDFQGLPIQPPEECSGLRETLTREISGFPGYEDVIQASWCIINEGLENAETHQDYKRILTKSNEAIIKFYIKNDVQFSKQLALYSLFLTGLIIEKAVQRVFLGQMDPQRAVKLSDKAFALVRITRKELGRKGIRTPKDCRFTTLDILACAAEGKDKIKL